MASNSFHPSLPSARSGSGSQCGLLVRTLTPKPLVAAVRLVVIEMGSPAEADEGGVAVREAVVMVGVVKCSRGWTRSPTLNMSSASLLSSPPRRRRCSPECSVAADCQRHLRTWPRRSSSLRQTRSPDVLRWCDEGPLAGSMRRRACGGPRARPESQHVGARSL